MCILPYIYGSYSLELGGDIELFCVVQDFCLVTVRDLEKSLLSKYMGDIAQTLHRSLFIHQNYGMLDSIFTVIELRNHGNSIKFHLESFCNLSGISIEFPWNSTRNPQECHSNSNGNP